MIRYTISVKAEMPPGWMSADEAAPLLRASPGVLRIDAQTGRIPSKDRGPGNRPRWLLSAEAVHALAASGGRPDRRTADARPPRLRVDNGGAAADLRQQLTVERANAAELSAQLKEALESNAFLHAEIGRLRTAARNANVATLAQTESLQQFLIDDAPGQGLT